MSNIEKQEEKKKDINFIRGFSNIRINKICEEEKISRGNLYTNKASASNIHIIKENIDNKIKKLYEDYDERNSSL